MVFYHEPRGFGPGPADNLIYVGRDKFENEDLIKYGLPHDVWFHVDDLSSAHVYLRLPPSSSFESIPADILEDCAQLVKANSIQGNKLNNITVVYTPWANLKKTQSMDVGQVSFKDNKQVKKVAVPKRINEIVNRLNKSKREEYPDLAGQREAYDQGIRLQKKTEVQEQRRSEKAAKDEAKRQQEARSYQHLMQDDAMVSSQDMASKYQSNKAFEDDFM
ncbi:hypothetical protein WJX74_010227 [Apatococcus lobatus]|uniref:NFACT RNA-binding domain-containing protein n=2 Tax=Apatococcus TaxID=904362 RepID=A0AAW1SRC1_9CHLO